MRALLLATGLLLLLGCGQKTSEEHLEVARQYIEQKKMDSAIVELKNAIQQNPRSAEARYELGRVYFLTKRYESAEKELNRALEFGYPPGKVIPLLSQSYQNTGALAALSEIDHTEGDLSPEQEVEVGYFKLQSLYQLSKIPESKALTAELLSIPVETVYSGLVQAFDSVLNEQPLEAISKLETLQQSNPDNVEVLKMLGQLYLENGRATDAAAVYKKYIEQYPDDNQITFMLANLLVEQNQVKDAEPYVDKLLKVNPENPLLNQLKAVIRSADSDYANAQSYAEKAIQSGRGDPILRLIAGHAAYIERDYEAANRHLSYIASTLPENHPGLKMLAASQLELGLADDASSVLSQIDNASEQDALLYNKTGFELIRSGNIKEAQDVIEQAAKISESAEDLTRLGVLRLSVNDLEGIVDLEKALEKSPDLEVTRATLANAYLATNQLDKAENLAKEWIASAPDDFKAYMLAGEVKMKRGDLDGAMQYYNDASAIEPENGIIEIAKANIEFIKKDFAAGEQRLLNILKKKADFVPALASYYLVKKNQGDGKEGMKPALAAKKANPDSVDLSMVLARIYLSEGEWQKVVDVANEVPENDDTPVTYWISKGKALLQLGNASEATEHYQRWLARSPNNKQANVGMLLILDSQGQFKDGAELTKRFLSKREDLEVRAFDVHFNLFSGNIEAARESFAVLPESTHELPVVKGFKARLLAADQEFDKALPLITDAYKAVPNSRNLAMLVGLLERTGKADAALSILQNHVEKIPNDMVAKMFLAERQIAGEPKSAVQSYRDVLEASPNNFVVLNNLAYLLTQSGEYDEAEDYARRAVALQPQNADAVDTLAQVLVKQEDYSEALKFYDRVINDKMQNNEIYLNYVETLLAAGNKNLARRKLVERKFEQEEHVQRVVKMREDFDL